MRTELCRKKSAQNNKVLKAQTLTSHGRTSHGTRKTVSKMAKKYQKGAKKHQKVLKVLPVLAYTTLVPCKLKPSLFTPSVLNTVLKALCPVIIA